MSGEIIPALVWSAVIAFVFIVFTFARRGGRRTRVGPGTAGTVYDWLNEDKRNALEIIVEDRAGARDPEDKDGNLPDLEEPKR